MDGSQSVDISGNEAREDDNERAMMVEERQHETEKQTAVEEAQNDEAGKVRLENTKEKSLEGNVHPDNSSTTHSNDESTPQHAGTKEEMMIKAGRIVEGIIEKAKAEVAMTDEANSDDNKKSADSPTSNQANSPNDASPEVKDAEGGNNRQDSGEGNTKADTNKNGNEESLDETTAEQDSGSVQEGNPAKGANEQSQESNNNNNDKVDGESTRDAAEEDSNDTNKEQKKNATEEQDSSNALEKEDGFDGSHAEKEVHENKTLEEGETNDQVLDNIEDIQSTEAGKLDEEKMEATEKSDELKNKEQEGTNFNETSETKKEVDTVRAEVAPDDALDKTEEVPKDNANDKTVDSVEVTSENIEETTPAEQVDKKDSEIAATEMVDEATKSESNMPDDSNKLEETTEIENIPPRDEETQDGQRSDPENTAESGGATEASSEPEDRETPSKTNGKNEAEDQDGVTDVAADLSTEESKKTDGNTTQTPTIEPETTREPKDEKAKSFETEETALIEHKNDFVHEEKPASDVSSLPLQEKEAGGHTALVDPQEQGTSGEGAASSKQDIISFQTDYLTRQVMEGKESEGYLQQKLSEKDRDLEAAERKVKDLQLRLKRFAKDDKAKDDRIFQMEKEIRDLSEKLNTVTDMMDQNQNNAHTPARSQQAPANGVANSTGPQNTHKNSKTCTIL